MKIGIGNDHVAVEYKKEIKKYIEEKYGYEVVNYGTDSTEKIQLSCIRRSSSKCGCKWRSG